MYTFYAEKFISFFLHYLTCSTTYPQNVEASAQYDVILRLNVFLSLKFIKHNTKTASAQ